MPRKSFVILCLLLPASIWAQHLSIGVTGGLGLTDAFIDQTTPDTGHTYSAAKDYLVGPAIELRLPFSLAVESDAVYRPLHLTESFFNVFNNSVQTSPGTINTWEFPLLVKYHLPGRRIRPFVEVGPSFRHTATSAMFLGNSPQLNHGFTAGGGGEISIWKLRIAPEIRYIRWAADTNFPFPNSDQAGCFWDCGRGHAREDSDNPPNIESVTASTLWQVLTAGKRGYRKQHLSIRLRPKPKYPENLAPDGRAEFASPGS